MPATPFAHAAGRDPRRLKIALISAISPWPAEPEALAALQHTAALLEALGHCVVPATLPIQLPEFLDATFDIIGSHTQGYLDLLGKMRGFPVSMDELEPRTRVILRERGQLSATRYISAVESMHALGRAMAGFFEEYDIVLTPTLNRAPPRLGSWPSTTTAGPCRTSSRFHTATRPTRRSSTRLASQPCPCPLLDSRFAATGFSLCRAVWRRTDLAEPRRPTGARPAVGRTQAAVKRLRGLMRRDYWR